MKATIFVLVDIESHEGLGRVVNALEAIKQFKEAKDDVKLYFDGTGTKWISDVNKKDHIVHSLFEAVSDKVGVCLFCTNAFGASDSVKQCNVD